MKKLSFVIVLLVLTISVRAQTVITQWKFNGADITSISGGTSAPDPSTGTGSLQLIGGVTAIFDPDAAQGSTDPDPNPPDFNLRTLDYPAPGANNKTAGIQFSVNTTGFNTITLVFDQRLSNTAANTWAVFYTSDVSAGSPVWVEQQILTFTPGSGSTTGDKWYNSRSVSFSGITSINDNPNAAFRIVAAFDPVAGDYLSAKSTSTYAPSGNSRFDMVTITGVPLVVTVNEAPVAPSASLKGIADEADTLKATYTYSDAEGDLQGTSTYKWFRATDANGTNATEIAGIVGTNYILTPDDIGKFVSFEVTPVALTGTSPGEPVRTTYKGPVLDLGDPSVVVINEVYSRGIDTNTNTDLHADWIEFHNPGDKPVTIARLKICDSGACQTLSTEDYAQLIIPIGGWLALAEDDPGSFTFGLSSNGEYVVLKDGHNVRIDSLAFPALDENQSYGRFLDGADNIVKLRPPTRAASNNISWPELGDPSLILINEVYSNGNASNANADLKTDWIELYNPSENDISLGGNKICNTGGCEVLPADFMNDLIVPAGGFLVLEKGAAHSFTFDINSQNDMAYIQRGYDDQNLDIVNLESTESTQSYGRLTDGTDHLVVLTPPTKGSSNNTSVDVTTGLPGELSKAIRIFPMPAIGEVTFEAAENVVIRQIFIYNLTGQEISSTSATSSKVNMQLPGISKGMYVVRITYGNGLSETRKLIKE